MHSLACNSEELNLDHPPESNDGTPDNLHSSAGFGRFEDMRPCDLSNEAGPRQYDLP